MTEEQIKQKLTIWAKNYCNNEEVIDSEELELFLFEALNVVKTDKSKQSESLGDYSVTLNNNALKDLAKNYLGSYRRVKYL